MNNKHSKSFFSSFSLSLSLGRIKSCLLLKNSLKKKGVCFSVELKEINENKKDNIFPHKRKKIKTTKLKNQLGFDIPLPFNFFFFFFVEARETGFVLG